MWLWKDSHSFPAYFCDSSRDGKEPDLKKQPQSPIQEPLSSQLPSLGLRGHGPDRLRDLNLSDCGNEIGIGLPGIS